MSTEVQWRSFRSRQNPSGLATTSTRLQEFCLHLQRANRVIEFLNKGTIDATLMRASLMAVSGGSAAPDTALNGKDREALRTIKEILAPRWR